MRREGCKEPKQRGRAAGWGKHGWRGGAAAWDAAAVGVVGGRGAVGWGEVGEGGGGGGVGALHLTVGSKIIF